MKLLPLYCAIHQLIRSLWERNLLACITSCYEQVDWHVTGDPRFYEAWRETYLVLSEPLCVDIMTTEPVCKLLAPLSSGIYFRKGVERCVVRLMIGR
jgi:hypothetical protein